MEAFSKIKQKGVSENSNFGGKTTMHKSTPFMTFLKVVAAPQVGVPLLLMAYCYATLILMLMLMLCWSATWVKCRL